MAKDFTIEHQFSIYLKQSGLLNRISPNSTQYIETKRTFYAACGQILLQLKDDIPDIEDEDEVIEIWESQLDEIEMFWKSEVKRQTANNN